MALTGIQIFKLLPKTNCGKCGVPTCLAFAMNLAAGKVELVACPFVSEESKAQLAEASAPPIRPVTIGTGSAAFKIGGETVMFRHEKKFENPTGIAVLVTDTMPESEVAARIERFNKNIYVRVGVKLHADAVAVKSESGNPAKFGKLVETVTKATDGGLILMSENPDVLAASLKVFGARKPLIYAATKANAAAVAQLAKENSCPVAVKGAGAGRSGRTDRNPESGRHQGHRYRCRRQNRQTGFSGRGHHPGRGPAEEIQTAGLSHDYLPLRNDCQPNERSFDCLDAGGEICRHRSPFRYQRRSPVPAAGGTNEYLHRPAAAAGDDTRYL